MKIKFNSDDNLPLNKPLKFHNLTELLDLSSNKTTGIIHNFF